MITEKAITKKSQEYTKFKVLYRKAFPRAERVPNNKQRIRRKAF